jgi:hypothetical protein
LGGGAREGPRLRMVHAGILGSRVEWGLWRAFWGTRRDGAACQTLAKLWGRTNKDGIEYLKALQSGLSVTWRCTTPLTNAAAARPAVFLACKGQCPGTAIDGDWRNRTEPCAVWMALFTMLEEEMLALGEEPISCHPLKAGDRI